MSILAGSSLGPEARGEAAAETCCRVAAGSAMDERNLRSPWRVREGALVICHRGDDAIERAQYLAVAGDLIGVEPLIGEASPSRVQALASATLTPVVAGTEHAQSGLLAQALAQSRRQARELLHLRSGVLRGRVLRLLSMLGQPNGSEVEVGLPPLRQLALLLDATPEAICRALTSMKHNELIVPQQEPRGRVVLIARPGPQSSRSTRMRPQGRSVAIER
jgi:hypothetical protein